ncbi:MAG: integrin alpha [Pseudomonadota bacterium]
MLILIPRICSPAPALTPGLRCALIASVGAAASAQAATGFSAELAIDDLFESEGGNGSLGFVLQGLEGVSSVSCAGDINGDGREDLLLGRSDVFEERVSIVFGPAEPFPPEVDVATLTADGSEGFTVFGAANGQETGNSVSAVGDVNGDGLDDILIGARLATGENGVTRGGQVYLILGSTEPFAPTFDAAELFVSGGGDGSRGTVFLGADSVDLAGRDVRGAGDINGDGVNDFLISAILADLGEDFTERAAGETYLIYGNPDGFPAEVPLSSLFSGNGGDGSIGTVLFGAAGGDESGNSVGAAGDVNGDGIDDIIIGAARHGDEELEGVGQAYVVYGRLGGLAAEVHLADLLTESGADGSLGFAINGLNPGERWATSVGGGADLNADGLDDVFLSAFDGEGDTSGDVAVVFGRDSGLPPEIDLADLLVTNGGDGSEGFVLLGVPADPRLAEDDVLAFGDLNGDGIDDLILGAPDADAASGLAFIIYGRPPGTPFAAELELLSLRVNQGGDGTQALVVDGAGVSSGRFGQSLAALADFNGDGINDLLAGSLNREQAYVVYGQAGLDPRARVVGIDTRTFACRNTSTGQTVSGTSPDVALDESFACLELGLAFSEGDQLILQADGVKFSDPGLSGEASDLAPEALVTCTNLTTGQVGTVRVLANAWDCGNAGFQLDPGEEARVRIQGVVAPDAPPERVLTLAVSGVDTRSGACRNMTDPQTVTTVLPDFALEETVDCIALGLTATAGDSVTMQAKGRNFGSSFNAEFIGLADNLVFRCENLTTGQFFTLDLEDVASRVDCAGLGLEIADQDDVAFTIRGTVP